MFIINTTYRYECNHMPCLNASNEMILRLAVTDVKLIYEDVNMNGRLTRLKFRIERNIEKESKRKTREGLNQTT